MRVALIDLDRLHTDPASGLLVDDAALAGGDAGARHTISTTSVAYTLIALRTALRALVVAARAVLEQHARHAAIGTRRSTRCRSTTRATPR